MEVTSKFVAAIDQAIKDKKLGKCFRAANLREAFGGFAYNTYGVFLSKHEKDKAQHNRCKAYFERVGESGSGLYRRLPIERNDL